jgi:glycosyltransferase involved in cell wall biosynthesis
MRNTLLHRLTLIPEVIRLYYWAVRLGVRNFARFFHDYRLVEQSGLLWHSQYLQDAGDRIAGHVDPIAHYLAIGSENRRDPNLLFDSKYYLSEYSGVAESGINPLVHYLDHGAGEGRNPHPLFDTDYYLEHYSHLLAEGTSPLADFIENGSSGERNPCLLFDSKYYLSECSGVAESGINPLVHYLDYGADEALSTHRLFDGHHYQDTYGHLLAEGTTPLADFIENGSTGERNPCPLFDSKYYLSEYSWLAESGINPLVHYLDYGAGEGRDPHPLFDTDYYLEHYGHLLAEGTNPLAYFIKKGGYQGHHPSLAFDTTYYLEVDSDIAKANVIPVIHYLEFGITEGRYRWDSYKKYIENYLWPNWRYREAKNNISSFDYKPVFSIIMPVYNTTEKWLRKAIESVLAQIYPHWELCIADDCSKESHVRSNLEEFSARDRRIRVTYRDQSGHIATASNTALAMATGEFVALMDHDDELHDTALYENVRLLNDHSDADLIYSDEDKINENGLRYHPFFKPDWSPDTLLSLMYTGHLSVYRRSLVERIGGFRSEYNGSQDYDLVLRFTELTDQIHHIPKVLYHWRTAEGSTASDIHTKEYALTAAVNALENTIDRRGESGSVSQVPSYPSRYIVDHTLSNEPKVSVIIPILDRPNRSKFLNDCLESILIHTTYNNYEIILVKSHDADIEFLQLVERFQEAAKEKLKVVFSVGSGNLSTLINEGTRFAKGDVLALLADSMTIKHSDWLEKLVGQAVRRDIGAVGGLILKDDRRILSAGLTLVPEKRAIDSHENFPIDRSGNYGRLLVPVNVAALRSSFLVVKRSLFERHGEFDESLQFDSAGIDFCLWLLHNGYRNVIMSHVHALQNDADFERLSGGFKGSDQGLKDLGILKQKWKIFFDNDPYYNTNLTKESGDYRLDMSFLPSETKNLMKVWLDTLDE